MEEEHVTAFMEAGLRAWRNRVMSLHATSSLSSSSLPEESRQATENSPLLQSQNGTRPAAPSPPEETKPPQNSLNQEPQVDERSAFFASLSRAPSAALIHLILEYHQSLVESGQKDLAVKIAGSLAVITGEGALPGSSNRLEQELHGMDLLLKDGLFQFLLKINQYLPNLRSQVIRFKDVGFKVKRAIPHGHETLGTKALDMVSGPIRKKAPPVDVEVLAGVTGYIMPGSFTLVLGPPGCGKSSLHKVLAGRLGNSKTGTLTGSVTYNGKPSNEVIVQRLIGVVDANDFHLPFLTVKETMQFASDFSRLWGHKKFGPELREIMGETLEMGLDPKIELTSSMTGLKKVEGRIAGSHLIPSTSADERHRLSVAEMLVGAYAAYFFDELNEGADAKVTYDLVLAVLIFARVRQLACLVSLQQPSPETFELFDRVLLLARGRVVFQGHRLEALPYFATLGYVKPPCVETAEFLQEVCTEEGAAFLAQGFPRLSPREFADAWEASPLHQRILAVVDSPNLTLEVSAQAFQPLGLTVGPGPVVASLAPDSSLRQVSLTKTVPVQEGDIIVGVTGPGELSQPLEGLDPRVLQERLDSSDGPILLHTSRPFTEPDSIAASQYEHVYIRSMWYEMAHLTHRQLALQWRNKFTLYARAFQIVFLSLYAGFLFFQMKTKANQLDANLRRGVGFYSLMANTLINLGQYPALLEGRNTYYKQQAAGFYRPFSYWFSLFAAGAVYSLVEATIWSFCVYFISGLTYSDGGWHFWVYYLIVSLVVLHGSAMVRCVAFLAPDIGKANAITGVLIAVFVLFAGFLASRFKVPNYWLWLYYIDPLQWAITGILINEFNSSDWKILCTEADIVKFPQCRGRVGQTLGHAYLAKGQFYVDLGWLGVSIGVLVAWNVIWNVLGYLCIANIRHVPPVEEGALPSKELAKRDESRIFRAEDEEYGAHVSTNEKSADAQKRQKSILFCPVTLSWHDLSYSVFIPQIGHTRRVLDDVSGWARPGEMLALLGLSGAGKTTLLDALAGRYLDPHLIGGQILVNGYPKDTPTFARVLGFVDRQDAYWPYTTVKEALHFSAAMRLGSEFSPEERRHFVEEVLEILELKDMENRLVVSLGSRLAREQARRVMIGIELAGNPSVMLLDEPASGMDSRAAQHVLHCLKNIASTGRTVIATLHRPSIRQANVFDNAMLMKKGGLCVYFGPLGHNCNALKEYFEAIPGTPSCDPALNPLSYAMDCIGDGITDYRAVRQDFGFEYRFSKLALTNAGTLEGLRRSKGTAGPKLEAQGYGAGYLLQAKETIVRLQKQYWRNLHYSFGRFLSAIVLGLLIGSVYWQEDIHSNPGLNARAGQLFISAILFAVANAGGVIPLVLSATPAYKREQSLKLYSVFLYNLSWGLAEIPYLAVITLLFCSISFAMSGIATQSAAIFFQVWFIFFEFVLCITFLAVLLAFTVSFPPLASVVVPIVISVMVPTGGLVLVKLRTSAFFIWVYWLNPLQYALNAMTSVNFFCDVESAECMNGGQNLACATLASACPQCPCSRLNDTGGVFAWTQIKNARSLDHSRVGTDMMALALYAILFRSLAYCALRFLKHNRRT